MKKIKDLIKKIPRKYLITLGILLAIFFIWYFFIRTSATTPSYTYGKVKKGQISVEITGTGQISASNEIAMTSKASGRIVSLPVIVGQELKSGELIAQVDARDALINLQTAQIALQKLIEPADAVTTLQTKNAYYDSISSQDKSYEDGKISMASTFTDLPDIITGLNDIYNTPNGFLSDQRVTSLSVTAKIYRDNGSNSYVKARQKYDVFSLAYKDLSQASATTTIDSSLKNLYETVVYVSQAIKDAKTAVDYIKTEVMDYYPSGVSTASTNVASWTSKISTHLSDLSSAQTSIETANRSVLEKKESLTKLESGANPLDIQSEELSLRQKQYAYSDSFTRAPFDGILAKLNIKIGDDVSNGTSIGTFISKQKIATISLNEIDAAKIKVGQKVSLTIDAIDGLKIEGTVSEIDLVGTVSQGVVTYSVKISLYTQDDRIRSGMSVSANITTESKTSILIIPSIAIKNNTVQLKDLSYKKIETGLSNDIMTEVVSGLNEGDEVVTKTSQVAKTTTTAAPSIFGNVRATGGAGANRLR